MQRQFTPVYLVTLFLLYNINSGTPKQNVYLCDIMALSQMQYFITHIANVKIVDSRPVLSMQYYMSGKRCIAAGKEVLASNLLNQKMTNDTPSCVLREGAHRTASVHQECHVAQGLCHNLQVASLVWHSSTSAVSPDLHKHFTCTHLCYVLCSHM